MSALAPLSHDETRFELRCAKCRYGVVVRIAPDTCPMCRGIVWEHVEPAPDDAERKANRAR
jgi:rubrerythrin